jgi:tRNA pseudouridine38-40 synthase
VQAALEQAIGKVTQEDEVKLVASGRTDAGAHALQQVVAFSTGSRLAPDVLRRAVNAHLPRSIAVTHVQEMPADFHPRYDATSRIYRYLIWNRPVRSPFWEERAAHVPRPLNETAMQRAASLLVGQHDFGAFVPVNHVGSRRRMMYRAECRREGALVILELEASGFMRQMVRTIAGTLIWVGLGQIDSAEFQRILQSADRTAAAQTAPARGLYLHSVLYPEGSNPPRMDHDEGRPPLQGLSPRDSKEKA